MAHLQGNELTLQPSASGNSGSSSYGGAYPTPCCDMEDQLSLMEAGQWQGPVPGPVPGHGGAGLTVVNSSNHRTDLSLPAGTLFRLIFLGSVEVEEEGGGRKRRKRLKKTMVEEAVSKIKVCGLSVHNPAMLLNGCVSTIHLLLYF